MTTTSDGGNQEKSTMRVGMTTPSLKEQRITVPRVALATLIQSWQEKAERELQASRTHNHAGEQVMDAYCDGKNMARRECLADLLDLVGNQPPSGLRGDLVVPGTVNGEARDKAFDVSALRVLLTEASEATEGSDVMRLIRDLSAAVEHLLTEQGELRAKHDAARKDAIERRWRAEAAEAQRDQLRGYAQHWPTCVLNIPRHHRYPDETTCTCGLSKLRTTEPTP